MRFMNSLLTTHDGVVTSTAQLFDLPASPAITCAPIYQVFDIRTDIRPTVAEIDLGALRRNADVLRSAVGSAKTGLLAVLKADAYGHGAVACARALEKKVWGFAVSLVEEGVELRRAGIELPIVVLGCYYGLSHRDVVAYRLTPVVADVRDLTRFAHAADELSAPRVGIHLKVDTGMSRLGVRSDRLDSFMNELQRHSGLYLSGLCTHLYDADGEDTAPTEGQLRKLAGFVEQLQAHGVKPGVVHVANTAGAVRFSEARFDLVRAGIGLFGVAPSHTELATLWPVMSLRTKIISLRELPAGENVSYGGKTRVGRHSLCATLPVGYADGYTRRMSDSAYVLCGGQRCKVMAPITMDMTMVDVTEVAGVKVGDEVVLLGAQSDSSGHGDRITLSEMASWAGTIPWEVCTVVSKRVPRIYTGDGRT